MDSSTLGPREAMEDINAEPPPHVRPVLQPPSQTLRRQQQQLRHKKFPTLPGGHDFLFANNYDRNLTVEKARFETTLLPPTPTTTEDEVLSSSAEGGRYFSTFGRRKSQAERSPKKQRRRRPLPPMHGTARPAEIFHRNLVDAVSNAEDSDENEHYVYYPSLNRVHTLPSNNSKIWLGDWFRPMDRPKLRTRFYRGNYYYGSSGGGGYGGYTSDDEEAGAAAAAAAAASMPLLGSSRQHMKKKRRSSRWICINVCVGFALVILFLLLFTVYRATPLTDVQVQMGRVLASEKELIFDLYVEADNWNWWTVRVAEADLGVFAFSQIVPASTTVTAEPAEYLGSFYRFDEPLAFPSSLFLKDGARRARAVSQIRLKSPGTDASGNERWSRMIRYPYGLVVRGVLKYHTISFATIYPQSTAICDVARVDPTTGQVSKDLDQGYCFKE